jgi:hypothetical protein
MNMFWLMFSVPVYMFVQDDAGDGRCIPCSDGAGSSVASTRAGERFLQAVISPEDSQIAFI